MERLMHSYACDFLKLRCKCLAFTRFGFHHAAHPRFAIRTGFDATPCTVIGNRSRGRTQQLHSPLTSLLCCRNKVMQ